MSAPNSTNLEKQKRRHIVPLVGCIVAAIFGVVLLGLWMTEDAAKAPGPTDTDSAAPATGTTVPDVTTPAPDQKTP